MGSVDEPEEARIDNKSKETRISRVMTGYNENDRLSPE